jgi:hypothetical protein
MKVAAIVFTAAGMVGPAILPGTASRFHEHSGVGQGRSGLVIASASKNPLPTPVEAFGNPTEGFDTKNTSPLCYRYRTATPKSPLTVGGRARTQGFEISTASRCKGPWTWTWHIAGLDSQGFTACVGLAGGDTHPATLSFVGPKGALMDFRADGRWVHETTLLAGYPTDVLVTTWLVPNLVVRTTTAGASIGFVDDSLSAGSVPARQCG